MIGTILLSFRGGAVTVIFLEIQELESPLEPIRSLITALFPGE